MATSAFCNRDLSLNFHGKLWCVDNGSINGGDRGFSGEDLRSSRMTSGESGIPNIPSAATAKINDNHPILNDRWARLSWESVFDGDKYAL